MFHVLEHRGEVAQRYFRIDEIPGANLAAGDRLHGLANKTRRVMKSGLDRDFGIMQRRRIELDARALRAAAEEIHGAAAANHLHRPIPGAGRAYGLDHGVSAAAAFGEPANRTDGIGKPADVERSSGAQARGGLRLTTPLAKRNDVYAAARKHSNEVQTDGPASEQILGLTRLYSCRVHTT